MARSVAGLSLGVAQRMSHPSPPARPWTQGQTVILDNEGKPKWQAIIRFSNHGVQSRWSNEVLRALRARSS
jgi:hypothetical protein